jgi:outer membrane protein OmpA-like peptidoglycan-associated protein
MRPFRLFLGSILALCFAPQANGQTETQQAVRSIAIDDGSESPATWNLDIADRRTSRLTSGVQGATGLLHTSSADLGRSGILRFSGVGEYLHATNFPVPTAVETRSAATFAASFVPVRFFELYAAYNANSNTNSNSIPVRIQSIGDGAAGLKLTAHLASGLYSGIEGRAMLFSRSGGDSGRTSGWGASPRWLLTYDAREQAPQVPLRFHLNLGFLWDTTRALQPSRSLGPAEQFAFNANNFNRLSGSAGMEIPLPILTPFGEYGVTYPLGVPGNRLVDPSGNSIPLTAAMPQVATLGLKVTAIQDLTLIAAVDLRVRSSPAIGIPTPAPFEAFFGASLNVDPFRARTQIVPIVKEVPAASQGQGRIAGTVSDAATHAPIAGAVILFGPSDLPPVASKPSSGKFLSYELPRGAIKLKVTKAGYEDLEQDVQVESGRTVELSLEMKLVIKKTQLLVSVASENRSVAARVSIRGPATREVTTVEGSAEPLAVEVKPGAYAVAVSAPGYLGQTRTLEVGEGAELVVNFDLAPEPKEKLVSIVNNKLEMVRKIHFTPAKATLLPDSYALLEQVANLLMKSDIKRIKIVGHTDSTGSKRRNLRLSVARAASVATFLERAGIDRKKMETAGYGDARPVVPNLTARGREINRRVEILILD